MEMEMEKEEKKKKRRNDTKTIIIFNKNACYCHIKTEKKSWWTTDLLNRERCDLDLFYFCISISGTTASQKIKKDVHATDNLQLMGYNRNLDDETQQHDKDLYIWKKRSNSKTNQPPNENFVSKKGISIANNKTEDFI